MRCFQTSAAQALSAPFRLRANSERNSERFATFYATLQANNSRKDGYPYSLLFLEGKRKRIFAEDQKRVGSAARMAGLGAISDRDRADGGQGVSESVVSIRSRAARVLERDSYSGRNDSQKSSVYQKGKQIMGSAKIQGDLWGRAPRGWAEIQEPMHRPLWEAMLNASEVRPETHFLDAGSGPFELSAPGTLKFGPSERKANYGIRKNTR